MSHKKVVLIILLVMSAIVLLSAAIAFAGATNDLINRETERRERMVKKVLKEQGSFIKHNKESLIKLPGYKQIIVDIKEQHADRFKNTQLNSFIKPAPQAMVFVSLSMPDLSLKQIIQDADYYQIPVVIRGLYEKSFKKTFEKIFDLVKEKNKGGVLINPRWFKEYEIEAVPVFVITNNHAGNNAVKGYRRDMIYGNIPIKRALSIIAERGENADIANDILKRMANKISHK